MHVFRTKGHASLFMKRCLSSLHNLPTELRFPKVYTECILKGFQYTASYGRTSKEDVNLQDLLLQEKNSFLAAKPQLVVPEISDGST